MKVNNSPVFVNTSQSIFWNIRIVVLLVIILLLSACASHYSPESIDDPYGFFSGIWHGLVFPLSLVANIISWFLSLFDIYVLQDIQIIGRPNTGFFYYVGFILGLSSGGGGVGTATR